MPPSPHATHLTKQETIPSPTISYRSANKPAFLRPFPRYLFLVSSPCSLVATVSLEPDNLDPPPPQHAMQTRSKNIFKSKVLPEALVRYPLPKALLATSCFDDIEPTSYSTAAKHPAWREAMDTEFDALLRNDTWTLVPPSFDMNIVGYK